MDALREALGHRVDFLAGEPAVVIGVVASESTPR
jgi:hypothetical protein